MRVFIVEDDQILLLMLKRMVERLGFQLAGSAIGGAEAIKKIRSTNPDLVFMDIMLKDDIDGISVAEAIKDQNCDIIYITGNSDQIFRERAAKTGYHEYLVKPISFDIIKESVGRLTVKSDNSETNSG
ncbi:MAG: response regulator [Balneolaceae bacterium]|nr:response regulator [Balneolaceae bacterium]MCH8547369.1 response regulator [Balneolaceae bacterium]